MASSRALIAFLLVCIVVVGVSAGVADVMGNKDSPPAKDPDAQTWTEAAKEKLKVFNVEAKEKSTDGAEAAQGTGKSYMDMAKEKFDAFSKSASETVEGVKESVVGAAHTAGSKVKAGKDTTADSASAATHKASEAAQSVKDSTLETADSLTESAKTTASSATEKTGLHQEL